ncbi:TonB-dependent receptor [Chitinophaga sp. MM2321]|uniref:SusC/RagA family TonB-linked outer membrane protein n=1 Tax=Chitinophaga sp. MM2321 TaxID=3137178 RepID=UPI0032D5A3E0
MAQTVITGNVTSANGEPLIGATVKLKASSIGTLTNKDGHYSLSVPNPDGTLVISFIGYKSQEVAIAGRASIDLIMENKDGTLSDVVVVGYGSQKKANLTGAVDQIGTEFFTDRPVPNVTRALQGAIPNLNIKISDGRPVANPSFNIRGTTSIGAGGQALILIDGVPGDPLNVNPSDIESVTVLKDAASAAIYGARAVFGVVLITTKSTRKGKAQITYSGSYSNNQRTVTPDLIWDGYTWAERFREASIGWTDYIQQPATVNNYLPFSQTYLDSLKYRSEHPGLLPEVTINPADGKYVYYGNTDWYKLLYVDNIPSTEHALSASGGNDQMDYAISGRYYSQSGLFRFNPDKYNRYNLRFKGGIKLSSWLKLTNNADFSSYNYREPMTSNRAQDIWTNINNSGFPMAVLLNPDGNLSQAAAQGVGEYYYGKSRSITQQTFIRNTLGLAATAIKNKLNIKADFTYQYTNQGVDQKVVPVPFSVKPNEVMYSGSNYLKNVTNKTSYYSGNLYGEFIHNFGNHHLKVLLGENVEISNYRSLSMQRDNLILPDKSSFNLATGQNYSIVEGADQWSTVGTFYRLNYDFKNKYLLEFNGRYDGSSKFPANERFGFFPSVSAGWRLAEEGFMKDTRRWLDNFKLRGSYGTLGNGQIGSYRYIQQVRAGTSATIVNGVFPTYIQQPGVIPDGLTWEKATTLDLGVDIDVLHNRLSASFDWYQRNTTDMITSGQPLPAVFGAAVPVGNYADLSTKGFEASLRWSDQIKSNKPINYSFRFTLSDNQSYITKFYNPNNLISTYYVGQRVGDIWGYVNDGFFTSKEDIASHADQSFVIISSGNKLYPGDIKFKDLNEDGKINKGKSTVDDHGDIAIIGNSQPRFTYSINSNWDWNNFSLSVFFQGVGKRNWYPGYESDLFWGQYGRSYAVLPKHTLDHWTEDNPDAYFPRYRFGTTYPPRQLGTPQTRYLQNVSYIRLKDLTIGYTLPQHITKRMNISNVRFYLSGQNIWTFSPMFKHIPDIDPETIEVGTYQTTQGDGNVYPMLKTYTFGVNVTF